MSNPVDKKVSDLVQEIEQRHRQMEWKRRISNVLLPLSLVVLGIAAFSWIEQYLYFAPTTKIIVITGLPGLAFGLWWRRKRETTFPSLSDFYSEISDDIQEPSLKHALDLSLKSRDRHLKLYESALKKNVESFSWHSIQSRIDEELKKMAAAQSFRQSAGTVAFSTLFLLLTAFVHPDAVVRTAEFWNTFQKPNPYSFTITPGTTTIEQGGSFQPTITFDGSVPKELLLGIKTDVEKKFRFRPLQKSDDQTYTAEPIQLSSTASYYVSMDEFNSNRYRVNVQLRPRFESLSVEVYPPDYTRLDSSQFNYPFSQVRAYQGSEIKIRTKANKPLRELNMISSAGSDTSNPVHLNGDSYLFNQKIRSADTLQFTMIDSSGLTNSNNFSFVIDPVQDEHPFIELLDPTENVKMSAPSPLDLTYRTSDDFGITSAVLHYEIQRAFTQQPESGSISLNQPELNTEQTYSWNVPALNPRPRDVITFWLEVTDNDGYNGYKQSQSRKLTITLPSLVENIEEIDKQESEVQKDLEEVSDSFEQMQKEYDRFKQNLKRNPETNYEQKQMLEQVQEKQEEIDKQVEELNRKFEEIRKEINKNDLVSEETRNAYNELQQLMKEIDDPQLKKALEELQKSLGNLNQQELREALEKYEFSEQQYKERLKRTIELFKSLKINSDLEKMATALEDLAEKEKELSESESSPSEQAEQQEAIQNDTEKVSEQMDNLDENAPEKAQKKIQELEQQSKQELDSIKKEIQKNIEQLKQQNSQQQNSQQQRQHHEQQQQIQQQFQQLSQKMRNAKQQFNQQRMQVNMAALQNILYNLVNLSEEQEELTQSTENLANRSQAFVDKARTQKNITRQFVQVSDSLFAVSSEIPGFSNQINTRKMEVEQNLQRSVEQLAERNKSQATYAERQAFGGINELASMIASLMEQLQNKQQSGMGGGMSMQQFMKQLKNMSGSQQKLNQQIQNLINDIQGDRLSRDQIDRLNQLAKQQNRIRKQLRELQQEGGLEGGDKLLSELERMSEEMEKTINDLRGGQTDGELVKRQQNILSRMLSAEKAMQERGKKDEREGTPSEETPRSVPPDMTLEELQKRMRNLLNDPNQTKFSEDYQRLIEQYFELLKQLEEEGDPS